MTDFVDVYLLASPWTGFNNFVFSTGSAAIDLPNDATLGMAGGGMVLIIFISRQESPTQTPIPPILLRDLIISPNTATFSNGWRLVFHPSQDKLYFDNVHLTFGILMKGQTGQQMAGV